MKVLVSESKDKQIQNIINIPYEEVLRGMETDNNWHEVIFGYDLNIKLRVFFDIDYYEKEDPLDLALKEINEIFKCNNDDWAISCGNREDKFSYHILSKKYYMTLKNLRKLNNNLNYKNKFFDNSTFCISMMANNENLFFRFPNQSKNSINKSGQPMNVIQGELKDFFVTKTEELKIFEL
jgi:hypothetical protein